MTRLVTGPKWIGKVLVPWHTQIRFHLLDTLDMPWARKLLDADDSNAARLEHARDLDLFGWAGLTTQPGYVRVDSHLFSHPGNALLPAESVVAADADAELILSASMLGATLATYMDFAP